MGVSGAATAVVGATGPAGIHLVRELVQRGLTVRAVSRSAANLERCFAGLPVELRVADALNRDDVAAALAGCDRVVDCIGLPVNRIADHPRTAAVLAAVVGRIGARCVQVSSYWSYLPATGEVIDENHPRHGGNTIVRARREAEELLLGAGAAVVHLPDFYGPEVGASSVQMALEEAVRGKPVSCIGAATTAREAGFIPDLMALVARLLERPEAQGHRWALPGSGPLSPARLAELAGTHLGRPVRTRAAPLWLLRVLALFSSDLRAFLPMAPHYAQPVRYDAGKLAGLLGPPAATPHHQAVPATLDWIRKHRLAGSSA